MICDETIATDSEGVLAFLTEKGHPALAMDAIM
jgi:acetyl-CoA synthase